MLGQEKAQEREGQRDGVCVECGGEVGDRACIPHLVWQISEWVWHESMAAMEVVWDSHPIRTNQKTANWRGGGVPICDRSFRSFHICYYWLLEETELPARKAKGRPKVPKKTYQMYPQRELSLHCSPQSGTPRRKSREQRKGVGKWQANGVKSSLNREAGREEEQILTHGTASLVYILERGLKEEIDSFKNKKCLKYATQFSLQKAQWEQVLEKIKLPI